MERAGQGIHHRVPRRSDLRSHRLPRNLSGSVLDRSRAPGFAALSIDPRFGEPNRWSLASKPRSTARSNTNRGIITTNPKKDTSLTNRTETRKTTLDAATRLAVDRTRLSYERTLM